MSTSSSNPRRYWRPNAANGTRPPSSSRLLRLVLLTVCVLALGGVIAGLLTLIRPHHRAYFLALAIDQYGESFPFRRWVQQDKEALGGLPWQQQGETFTLQRRSLIEDQLKKLADRPAQDTVVIYLSGHVRTRDKGELSLIPVDGELDDQNTWIPLDEVFERLRVCPAAHKLLLLDVMQPCIDLEKGLLNNNAAYLLQPLLEEKIQHDPHLSVLTACAPGQVSHTSEELGRSVFVHFVYLGLSGMADGATGKVKDRFVSVGELAAYVKAEVDQWAARYRGTRQTPQLYGFGATEVKGGNADFRLVRYEPGQKTPEAGAFVARLSSRAARRLGAARPLAARTRPTDSGTALASTGSGPADRRTAVAGRHLAGQGQERPPPTRAGRLPTAAGSPRGRSLRGAIGRRGDRA